MNVWKAAAACAVMLLCAPELPAARAEKSPRARTASPNVVLITLDALRQDHLSFNGYKVRQTTPTLDRLSRKGLFFPNIIPTGCSTKASLTSLFVSTGFEKHRVLDHDAVLSEDHTTLAETFRMNGYQTVGFVASPHLAAAMRYDQGFAVYNDFSGETNSYVRAETITDRVLQFLAKRKQSDQPNGPFFAYIHFEEPHPPWLAENEWTKPESTKTSFFDKGCSYLPTPQEFQSESSEKPSLVAKYDASIRYADEQIGRVISQLEADGDLANTIVAISTDHGIELLDRYSATHGYNPFDEVVRGFLLLYDGRGVVKVRGGVSPKNIQGRLFDIGPTLFRLARLEKMPKTDGRDMINDYKAIPPVAFTQCYGAISVRSADYKLIYFNYDEVKRLPRQSENDFVLYDLRSDPYERKDIQFVKRDVYRAMRKKLIAYMNEMQKNPTPSTVPLDAETLERLKSLGYIQ
jgi:arylsulfatase A-like enzyme